MKIRSLSSGVHPPLSRREGLDLQEYSDLKVHPVISPYSTTDKPLDDLIYEYSLIYGLSVNSSNTHLKGNYIDSYV